MGRSEYRLKKSRQGGRPQYPKTLVEAVYWDKKKKPLGDVLEELEQGGGSQVQSDWNQTDDTQPDYIKNKPNISGGGKIELASSADWLDISNQGQQNGSKQALLDAIGMVNRISMQLPPAKNGPRLYLSHLMM